MAKRSLTATQRLTTDQPAPPLEGRREGAQGAPCPKSKKYFLDCVNGRGLASSVGQSVGRLVTPGAVHYPSAPAACGYSSWPDSEVYYLATLSVLDSAGLYLLNSRVRRASSGYIRVKKRVPLTHCSVPGAAISTQKRAGLL